MRSFITVLILAACGGDREAGTPDASTTPDAPATPRCQVTPTQGDPLVVATDAGEVRGVPAGDTTAFLGIPYAAPPTGARRFRPPEPAACRQDVRPADRFGHVCPQLLPSGSRLGDEDCLVANVWTPSTTGAPRPVLVFIHGGAYEIGSGNQDLVLDGTGNLYDGRTLAAEHDAVVVTFNYRLGELGFLAHPALAAEDAHGSAGNYGTLDQIAALQWVHDNIAAFGGDPARVMIFGESAGGLSVCLLLGSPLARGLFASAIVESGGCAVATQSSRFAQGARVAERVGCTEDPATCLRERDAFAFVSQVGFEAGAWLGTDPARLWEMLHGPNLDGYVFVEDPLQALRASHVPVVIGSNADEFALFTPPMLTCADYVAFVAGIFGTRTDEVVAQYSCFDFATPRAAAVAVMTDHMFTCEARRAARAASEGAPVHRYWFTRTYHDHALAAIDSFHTAELPFVFRTFSVLGYAPDADDSQLSRAIGDAWAQHAATGDPGPAWPAYDAAQDTALQLDAPLAATTRIRAARCDFWDAFIAE